MDIALNPDSDMRPQRAPIPVSLSKHINLQVHVLVTLASILFIFESFRRMLALVAAISTN